MKTPVIVVALCLALASLALPAQEAGTAAAPPRAARPNIPLTASGLGQRHEFVGNLIERSSSSRQLDQSASPEAGQLQRQAREAHARARQALDAGDLERADALLREATQSMMSAVRLTRPDHSEKLKADYANRRDTVRALMPAGQRFAGENQAARPDFGKAEELLKEADMLAAANRTIEAKARLDLAYLLIKATVRDLGDGKTVVDTTKNFATPADEYKYDQATNDSYQSLIAGVVKGQADPGWESSAATGRRLREEADAMARAGDHAAALRKLGESTGALKGILRRAGFPIL